MAVKLGAGNISKLYLGSTEIQKAYLGSTLVYQVAASGFDADYQAILDYATTQGYTLPSAGQQTLQNQLVLNLKAAGIWSKLEILLISATDGDSDFAIINWLNPGSGNALKVNTPLFTSNLGFTGDGVSANLSVLIPDGTGNFKQDDACIFYKRIGNRDNTNRGDFRDDTNSTTQSISNGFGQFKAFNSGSGTTAALNVSDADILFALNRAVSTEYKFYKNGVDTFTNPIASTGIPVGQISFLGHSGNFHDSTHGFKLLGFSSSLTATEHANLNTHLNTYLNAL